MPTYRREMQAATSNRTSRRYPLALLLLALTLAVASCDFLPIDHDRPEEGRVAVMTQNLYVGADLQVITGATSPEEVPLRVAQFYGAVLASDFPERAKAIAEEIKRHRPDLIGLQEVSLFRRQAPSDFVTGTTEPNAETVTLDFLALLQSELASRGLNYHVAADVQNADAELPGLIDGQLIDVRLTDRDVILAREGVETTPVASDNYEVNLVVSVGGVETTFLRGYAMVEAEVDGEEVTFVNTHLETTLAPPVQLAQAVELLAVLESVEEPVILVGDFNSAADGSTTETYALLAARYADAFVEARPGAPGPTCCQAADLLNLPSLLSERIDLILYRGEVEATEAYRVGKEPSDRTPSGRWPSDHAGVVALLELDD